MVFGDESRNSGKKCSPVFLDDIKWPAMKQGESDAVFCSWEERGAFYYGGKCREVCRDATQQGMEKSKTSVELVRREVDEKGKKICPVSRH